MSLGKRDNFITNGIAYHVGNVDAGTVATAHDAQTETSAGFLQQFHFDDVEHVVVFQRSLVAVDHHPDFGRRLSQDGQCPAVCNVTEALAIDLQDLIARFESLVSSGRSVRIHFVNQNGSLLENNQRLKGRLEKKLPFRFLFRLPKECLTRRRYWGRVPACPCWLRWSFPCPASLRRWPDRAAARPAPWLNYHQENL